MVIPNMNITEKTHRMYIMLLNDPTFKKTIKKDSPANRNRYQEFLNSGVLKREKEVSFVNFLLDMSENKYYLAPLPEAAMLINREFKSIVTFRYCTSLTEATKKILVNYNECIEIIELHSQEKGQGTIIMNEFIELSESMDLPLSLYVETNDLVKYYNRFGFVDYGSHGGNSELLLLRLPEKD